MEQQVGSVDLTAVDQRLQVSVVVGVEHRVELVVRLVELGRANLHEVVVRSQVALVVGHVVRAVEGHVEGDVRADLGGRQSGDGCLQFCASAEI